MGRFSDKTKQMVAFYTMFVGTFMLVISQSMMINALPQVMGEFHITAQLGQLTTTGYILSLGMVSAASAWLVDSFSTKRVCLGAFGLFFCGCVLCVWSPNFEVLLAGRFMQALGAGTSLPLIQDVALAIYPKEQYGRAMGAVGLIIGFAPALGPAIAGPIIDAFGWRALFVILGSAVAIIALISSITVTDLSEHHESTFNVISMLLLFLSCMGVLVGLSGVFRGPYGWVGTGSAFVVSALLFAGYVRVEYTSDHPLLHIKHFWNKRFRTACVLIAFAQTSMMTAAVMVPLYIQEVQGASATISGLLIMPGAILMGVLNPYTGRLYDKLGARPVSLIGCMLILMGTLLFILCDATTPGWILVLLYGLRTIGIAFLWMPMVADASKALPPHEKNQASSITTAARQLSSSLLAAVFVSIMSLTSHNHSGVSDTGFDISFGLIALLTVAALAFAFAKVEHTPHTERKHMRFVAK